MTEASVGEGRAQPWQAEKRENWSGYGVPAARSSGYLRSDLGSFFMPFEGRFFYAGVGKGVDERERRSRPGPLVVGSPANR